MSFPLYYVLFLYLAFLALWLIFSLVGIYHLLRFGFKNFFTFFIVLLYISVSVGLLLFSYYSLGSFDWEINVSLFSGNNINNFN